MKSILDLEVYVKAHKLAMKIFHLTVDFPKEEKHALTDQLRLSSRNISVSIADGWSKRNYEPVFRRCVLDAIGYVEEARVWMQFAFNCDYLNQNVYSHLITEFHELLHMLERLSEDRNEKVLKQYIGGKPVTISAVNKVI